MTREEAIAIAQGDPQIIADILLRMSQTIDELRVQVAELQRKIALVTTDSSNSSKPPSSDGPAAKPRARRPIKSKKRKRGGQPGHKGANRNLIPTEQATKRSLSFPKLVIVAAQASPQNRGLTSRPESIGAIRSWIFPNPNLASPNTSFIASGARVGRRIGAKSR